MDRRTVQDMFDLLWNLKMQTRLGHMFSAESVAFWGSYEQAFLVWMFLDSPFLTPFQIHKFVGALDSPNL